MPSSGGVLPGSAARIAAVASGFTLVTVSVQPFPSTPGLPSGTTFSRLLPGADGERGVAVATMLGRNLPLRQANPERT